LKFDYIFIRLNIRVQIVDDYMLILASASQSRKNLLKSADIEFIQISSSFDESSIKNDNLNDLALELSFSKAKNVMNKILELDLNVSSIEILGCDSIFEFKGKAYGKPINKKEAYDRWVEMSAKFGYLHTGHTLIHCEITKNGNNINLKKIVNKVLSSKIYFSELNSIEINNYVDSLEPMGCAGGFTLEGKGGKFIEKIEGCFSNVMGLSLPWLRKELLKEGIYA